MALLLAGGASRRLGRDKTLLDERGMPQLQARVDQLTEHFEFCVVAADRRRPVAVRGAVCWPDSAPGDGPLPALADALERWREPLYLCAVDMPDPIGTQLALLEEARRREQAACAWLFERDDILQPLGGIYAAGLAAELRAAYVGGERSLWRFLRGRDDLCRVPGPATTNLNEPDQLARWRRKARDV